MGYRYEPFTEKYALKYERILNLTHTHTQKKIAIKTILQCHFSTIRVAKISQFDNMLQW